MAKYHIIRGGLHQQFLSSRKKYQVLAGGFGNGKTAAACVKAIQLAEAYPGSNGLIARETYPKLNDTIRKEFYKWVPRDAVRRFPTKDDNTLVFKNGSVVNFRYISQRGKQSVEGITTSNLLSATYDWIIVDQMEDPGITYKDFLDLNGRLRGSTPYKGNDPTMPMTGPRFFIMTSNPTANWFYKKIVKPYHQYRATGLVTEELICDINTKEPLIEIFEGSTYENKHNLDPDFIQGLEATYKGQFKRRFLMGEWAAYEGLVYPEFNSSIHMISQQQIQKLLNQAKETRSPYTNLEGFDYGIVSPSCFLTGFTDYIGRVFIIDGFYAPNMRLNEINSEILRLREKYYWAINYTDPIWADPSIFKRTITDGTGKTTDTVGRILKEQYELYIKRGQNDIISGISKVSEYLAIQDGMHFEDSDKPGPMMYFADHLSFIEDEITSYFWKADPNGERMDVPRDVNDHAMDTIKYLVSMLPEASTLHYRKPVITPEYLKWQEER